MKTLYLTYLRSNDDGETLEWHVNTAQSEAEASACVERMQRDHAQDFASHCRTIRVTVDDEGEWQPFVSTKPLAPCPEDC